MKQGRRIFLKVLASSPALGCAGTAETSAPDGGGGDVGGTPSSSTGGASGSGANAVGGNPFSNGGGAFGSAGRFGTNGGTSAAGASAAAGSSGASSGLPGMVVATVSSIAMGSLTIAAGIFFLGRDAGGIYAMTMQCTHKGCAVELSGKELKCPCHGARFTWDGQVLQGPAQSPLPHLAVFIDAAGNVSVDRYTVVSASTRVPV